LERDRSHLRSAAQRRFSANYISPTPLPLDSARWRQCCSAGVLTGDAFSGLGRRRYSTAQAFRSGKLLQSGASTRERFVMITNDIPALFQSLLQQQQGRTEAIGGAAHATIARTIGWNRKTGTFCGISY
jgi:hypothetical protein